MQHCAKRVIAVGSIAEMVIARELFEPSIRLLDRVVQGRNLSVIHGFVLGPAFSALLEYRRPNLKAETPGRASTAPSAWATTRSDLSRRLSEPGCRLGSLNPTQQQGCRYLAV